MRRRYILALVLATALIFGLAGAAVDHWAIPDNGANCNQAISYYNAIKDLGTQAQTLIQDAGRQMTAECTN
jgi:hypothetical protein